MKQTPSKRLRGRALLSSVLVALVAVVGFVSPTPPAAHAANAQNFNPGTIISDDLFYDGFSMSAAEVQQFLNRQVPRCTIGDSGRTPGMAWGTTVIANQCLRDLRLTTQSRSANAYCSAYVGASQESAASIIAKVSQACKISPKVLLVMLEKEQSLVSDTWPSKRQFDLAMGYACPDSGPNNSANCDPTQTGFMQQVYRAAWQLQVYKAHPTNYRYQPFKTNTIQWHPNASCGTSSVHITNYATAALYIYTPYRPNQAALNAQYGLGDSCSSYGNRNFFLRYSDWFGSPTAQTNSPVGEVKELWVSSKKISLWGWAVDPDSITEPVQIHVKFGSQWAATTANAQNSTAEIYYPGAGNAHGFGLHITAPPGPQQVCVYAKNLGSGTDKLLTCQQVNVPSGNPDGQVKDLWATPGKINMWGWALDPDATDPIDLHVSVNGKWTVVKADAQNLSTTAQYPQHGTNHGFGATIPAPTGPAKVCVYAINRGVGSNTTLFCETVNVPTPNPVGAVREMWATPGKINMWGWALDPDTTEPIDLHVSLNGKWAVVRADAQNLAAAELYPRHGTQHGFGASIPADPGMNRVCVYAINQGGGANTTLSCQNHMVPAGNPQGQVKELWGDTQSIGMWGWAADPDTQDPIDLHVRVDGTNWFVVPADSPYQAMPSLMPGVGINHGFGTRLPSTPGRHEVCVFAVNVGSGTNQLLRCDTVTVK